MKTLLSLEIKENEIKSELDEIKKIEVSRIFREFQFNDYARRYNTTREKVVSVLIGEDNMNMEISKQMRSQKVKKLF